MRLKRSRHVAQRVFLGMALLSATVLLVVPAAVAVVGNPPSAYSEFTTVTDAATLKSVIEGNSVDYIYLPVGTYVLDNPVVISRTTSLHIHGVNRASTRLVALDPSQPLFEIQAGTVVNFANLNLNPALNIPTVDSRAILLTNQWKPIILELLEVRLEASVVDLSGPSFVRVQGTHIVPHGYTTAPILLDHPGADVLIVGGNSSNLSSAPQVSGGDQFHVWAKQGRLRIYGMGVQAALGVSDFRIDRSASSGPHVIANVRSEGSNGYPTGHPSTMLTVPTTTEAVDVLMKVNSYASNSSIPAANRLVDYNGTGTVWMLGNNSNALVETLAVGSAPGATMVAIGNRLGATDPIQTTGAQEIEVHNIYKNGSTVTFVSPGIYFADRAPVPEIPNVPIPDPLTRPIVDIALPGMLDVTTYGAIPDDGLDDLASIQAAFDVPGDGRHVYFPAGTYHVSDSIKYNFYPPPAAFQQTGGWIAGAGSATTEIVRIGGGSVFATNGMAYNTIQGLTFRTDAFVPTVPPLPELSGAVNFAIEYVKPPEGEQGGHASQEIMFHDVVFDGGQTALGIGLNSPDQCSENMMVQVEFRNAQYGLGIGRFNALANIVYDGTWVDNETNVGHQVDGHAGTWAILGGFASGTTVKDFEIRDTARGIWYHEGYTSDAPTIYDRGWTPATYPVWFEDSYLAAYWSGPAASYQFAGTAGPIFLRSTVGQSGLNLDLNQSAHASFGLNLYSTIPLWDQAGEGPAGQIDKLD